MAVPCRDSHPHPRGLYATMVQHWNDVCLRKAGWRATAPKEEAKSGSSGKRLPAHEQERGARGAPPEPRGSVLGRLLRGPGPKLLVIALHDGASKCQFEGRPALVAQSRGRRRPGQARPHQSPVLGRGCLRLQVATRCAGGPVLVCRSTAPHRWGPQSSAETGDAPTAEPSALLRRRDASRLAGMPQGTCRTARNRCAPRPLPHWEKQHDHIGSV
mmetsp:Transcript_32163/g.74131  ORF Transcript_32163/g.74131 Transcript_32163/m.74131 type:complete len:215 (-) Transcript_32163:209-853(-)